MTVSEFITPIVKCTKGDKELSFFTMPEFENWVAKTPDAKNWKVKYYKRHKKPFAPMKEGERELIDMVFNKKKADDRKTWINYFEPGTYDEQEETDFISRELILFSRADKIFKRLR